jgi:Pyruvate/2-oxoglutarate dehydrogenase complex, dihydrolipoamide dehydrogenase (E3) component, and related enzymes
MYTYQKEIPLRHTVDIFIAGGGPAGLTAGITAARQGKKVFIAELAGFFGGGATAQLVPVFMQFTDGNNFLAGGIGREIHDLNGGSAINSESIKVLYDNLVKDSGADFSFFTNLLDVVCDSDGHIDYVICNGKSGLFAVKAGVYLDCTGDGDLCAMAGADYEFGDDEGNVMGTTLCSAWTYIDWARVERPDDKLLQKAYDDGVFTDLDLHLPGMFKINDRHGGGNIGHCFNVDATDERSLTDAMVEGRRKLVEYKRYYNEYLKGYEDMYMTATAPYLGVRESRRITGDYIMTKQDFLDRASFEDEIGRYSYPVDIHEAKPGKEANAEFVADFRSLRYKTGESYGIPYRALTPKGMTNVLVAGRCMSTDRAMQSSIRVMPGCFITGQAIGMAATLAVDTGNDVRAISVGELQDKLVSVGGYLPNRK